MGLPNEVVSALIGAANQGGYEIDQSLRFEASSSSRLTRTPSSSSNMRTWTLSMWVKKWNPTIDGKYLWAAGVWSSGNTNTGQYWTGPNKLASVNGVNSVNNNGGATTPGRLYRDPSAWFHLVVRMDTANATDSNRHRIYLNGEYITSASGVTQNFEGAWNRNVNHAIGGNNNHGTYSDVYIAEVHNVDGQSLDPTSFGEFDESGVWRPIAYSGSYGTNGFYLKMDPSAANGVGHDHSGNGNHFTASGLTTSGTGTDVMSDTPTNNWCTSNGLLNNGSSFNNGNLSVVSSTSSSHSTSTFAVSSGKWYWECTPSQANSWIGVSGTTGGGALVYDNPLGYAYGHTGNKGSKSTGSTSYAGASYTANDVIGVALNLDDGEITFYKNGTSQGVAFTGLSGLFSPASSRAGAVSGTMTHTYNFGQRAFEYTQPTGFKALNTSNLPAPDIADGSDYFNTVLYTGDGQSSKAITGVGFQPNLSVIKNRSNSNHHIWQDSVRGITANNGNQWVSSNNFVENGNGNGHVGSYDSDGFTVEDGTSTNYPRQSTNYNNHNYVAWLWKAGTASGSANDAGSIDSTVSANASAGFSIVTYTGSGSNATVGHGLGVAPEMVIIKSRSNATEWIVYHSGVGATKFLNLDGTGSASTNSSVFNDTAPTSTTFAVGTVDAVNYSNYTYGAYCFAEVEGYSKFGSYIGNGSSDGPFVYCGFRPSMVMLRAVENAGKWIVNDVARSTFNVTNHALYFNDVRGEESNGYASIDILSNGFKIRSNWSDFNTNNNDFVFAAFAENPFGGSGVSPATAR